MRTTTMCWSSVPIFWITSRKSLTSLWFWGISERMSGLKRRREAARIESTANATAPQKTARRWCTARWVSASAIREIKRDGSRTGHRGWARTWRGSISFPPLLSHPGPSPLHDLPIEPLPHPVRVHLTHRHHPALIGEAEDAGGEALLADRRPHLGGGHEVVAGEGEGVDAQSPHQPVEEQAGEGDPGLGARAGIEPAAGAAEHPARRGAHHAEKARGLLQGIVVPEGHTPQTLSEEFPHHRQILGLVPDRAEEPGLLLSALQRHQGDEARALGVAEMHRPGVVEGEAESLRAEAHLAPEIGGG